MLNGVKLVEGMCKCVVAKGIVATEETRHHSQVTASSLAEVGERLWGKRESRLHRRGLDYSQECLQLHGTQVAAEQFEST